MLGDISIYLGVALAGLVSFLSPCVLPAADLDWPLADSVSGGTDSRLSDLVAIVIGPGPAWICCDPVILPRTP